VDKIIFFLLFRKRIHTDLIDKSGGVSLTHHPERAQAD
jgi:hypothetical protein